MPKPDLRLIAWRPDLAHMSLRGVRVARRYVSGQLRQCARAALPLCAAPRVGAPMFTQLLYGEGFRVLEEKSGWAWGQCQQDGYVGYLQTAGLGRAFAPACRLGARAAFVFARPDICAPVRLTLSLGALLAVRGKVAGRGRREFLHLRRGGYLAAAHAEPWPAARQSASAARARFLEAARQCLHMPYLWGGRGHKGADCSGLVMQALGAAGINCPRDSDMQRAAFAPLSDGAAQPGDLAFWPGHVGIVEEGEQFLHASAYHGRVAVEPWAEASRRLKAQTRAPAYFARPPF